MQSIIYPQEHIHDIFNEIASLYTSFSDTTSNNGKLFETQLVLDNSFIPLVDVFEWYGDFILDNVEFVNKPYKKLVVPNNPKNIIVCFSGGKDSIACASKYLDEGYNVFLYHMKHINAALSDEWKVAEQAATELGVPLYVETISLKGKHMWTEHPMKNIMIAIGALEYGIRSGIGTNIAFGNYLSSILCENVFERCASDCMDMWCCFNEIIQRVIPNFEIHCNLLNMHETLLTLMDKPQLLSNSISCLCRHSLRDYRRNWVKQKFGVTLLNHRCGSCYKCCVEYIYLADHDKIEFNKDYYKYCFNQLYHVCIDESVGVYTCDDVWEHFIMYDMSDSKIYDDLLSSYLLNANVKWRNNG